MGFCIMFPKLCGLRTAEVAIMKTIVLDISDELYDFLSDPRNTDLLEREQLIEESRKAAIARLNKKGYVV